MADLVHLSSSASSEEIIDVLNKDAGVIIDNLLHSDDISRINKDLKPYLKMMFLVGMNLLDSNEKSWGINCKI